MPNHPTDIRHPAKYDIFISYAHANNREDQRWVVEFAKRLEVHFQNVAGLPPQLFLDSEQITTAQLWEERIRFALDRSTTMVAVLAAPYFKSEWCGREWDHFVAFEERRREAGELQSHQGLIFPVQLMSWDNILEPTPAELARIAQAESRQCKDFKGLAATGRTKAHFESEVENLAREIVVTLQRGTATSTLPPTPRSETAVPDTRVVTRIGTNREEFIARLSQANQITIVGITHQTLVECLQEALGRMRAMRGPAAFWQMIRIVFLSDAMLPFVEDELLNNPRTPDQASANRLKNASRAKKQLYRFFLPQERPDQWRVYEYNAILPFIGALFEMPDGQRVVQVATLRPGFRTSAHLFFEFVGMASDIAYYQASFEHLVQRSEQHEEIFLLGHPQPGGDGFVCTDYQYMRGLPMPGTSREEWVAAVLILLWQEEQGSVWPVLQIRTQENSVRELHVLSNLSGYINLGDLGEDAPAEFPSIVSVTASERAVHRELREELGLQKRQWADPQLVGGFRYYSTNRENLYFYVLSVRLDAPLDTVQPVAQLERWPLAKILRVREYQLLETIWSLLNDESKWWHLNTITEVIVDNLILHDRSELAQALREIASGGQEHRALQADVGKLVEEAKISYRSTKTSGVIRGLAAFQYRELFTVLLPAYAGLGASEAQACMAAVAADPAKSEALARLSRHYANQKAIHEAVVDV